MVASVPIVVIDTMTFSYLQGLGQLALLAHLGASTGRLRVTNAVLGQLHRSGTLGRYAQSMCDRGEIGRVKVVLADPISAEVRRVLEGKHGALVRRNRVDVELVEVARQHAGYVLSCERGIAQLAKRRHVSSIDLLVLFCWAIELHLLSEKQVEEATRAWSTSAAPGTGAPADWAGTFADTRKARPDLDEVVGALLATK
ncbi:MAG: hypothetical protein HY744_13120 [Deltaproteobacteria bacterium]|nr:hypothetical protein [Deltaproteobacteria bacterium]